MRKYCLLLVLLFISANSFAQNVKSHGDSLRFPIKYSLSFGLLSMSPSLQLDLGSGWTGRIAYNPRLVYSYSTFGNPNFRVFANPGLTLEAAYYPWLAKRITKDKDLNNFNGVFIGLSTTYQLGVPMYGYYTEPVSTLFAVTPGIKLTFLKYGFLNIQVGPGLYHSHYSHNLFVAPSGQIDLGLFLSFPRE